MKTVDTLMEISSKLEYLQSSAEWIARESVHADNSISQSGTLILVLAEDLKEDIFKLVHDLEKNLADARKAISYH